MATPSFQWRYGIPAVCFSRSSGFGRIRKEGKNVNRPYFDKEDREGDELLSGQRQDNNVGLNIIIRLDDVIKQVEVKSIARTYRVLLHRFHIRVSSKKRSKDPIFYFYLSGFLFFKDLIIRVFVFGKDPKSSGSTKNETQ